jgi:hypothetical protein
MLHTTRQNFGEVERDSLLKTTTLQIAEKKTT